MYAKRGECSALDAAFMSVSCGAVCGAIYGWMAARDVTHGLLFGLAGGLGVVAPAVHLLADQRAAAGWIAMGVTIAGAAGIAAAGVSPSFGWPVLAAMYLAAITIAARLLPTGEGDPTVCEKCGYDLTGSPGAVCPECGADVQP